MATGSDEYGKLTIWDIESGQILKTLKVHYSRTLHISLMKGFSLPDYPFIFCCGPEKICIVDISTTEVVIAAPMAIRSDSGYNGLIHLGSTKEVLVGSQGGKVKVFTFY